MPTDSYGKIGDTKQFIKFFRNTTRVLWRIQNNLFQQQVLTPTTNINVSMPKNLNVEGEITAKKYNLISDKNLKNNIQAISSIDINNLKLLSPVTFQFNTEKEPSMHYGLIAQDVEKIFPTLVSTSTSTSTQNIQQYKTINYIELIPMLIAKINHLEQSLEELKERRVKREIEK